MKLNFDATERNKEPILERLKDWLDKSEFETDVVRVLEIASGSGQHGCHFVQHENRLYWQPSDIDDKHIQSIDAWRAELPPQNQFQMAPATNIDANSAWNLVESYHAVYCANMTHISSWEATEGLIRESASVTHRRGYLLLYGPYFWDEVETAPSNVKFDESLKDRHDDWGVRRIEDVNDLVATEGGELIAVHRMPANNYFIIYKFNRG